MPQEGVTRRGLLRAVGAGSVAATIGSLAPGQARAGDPESPDAALKELMAGNERFVGRKLTSFRHDLDALRAKTAEKQEPFAAVLSCADSRVPVELIFDQSIGQLFVTRVAGNITTPEIIASLEYGAAALGTKVILVLGHANCGAVKATIEGKPVPGQISALYPHIQPAVDRAGSDLDAAIKANAQIQARLLREASPVLGGLIKEEKLKIVSGYYGLANGRVTLLG
jgi:carbonic anhydrase